VSSTAIRDDVAAGRPVLDRVSAPVARYIADQGLYRDAVDPSPQA
jgi:nicotinic acid mononucleotide adenylyltransferase